MAKVVEDRRKMIDWLARMTKWAEQTKPGEEFDLFMPCLSKSDESI